MLNNLKQKIQQEEMTEHLMESMTGNVANDAVKNTFLNGFDLEVLGAENDPEVKTLVDTIPEYDNHDSELEEEIKGLTESLLETQI